MKVSLRTAPQFQRAIANYYRKHKRMFPWRPPSLKLRKDGTADPYAILVSEVMLQQTQAERVVPFHTAFLKRFPTPQALADASVGEVLRVWSGLGYNRRALNLKRAAETIVGEYKGIFPKSVEAIDALPGVGPYTAGAIAAFAFNTPSAFIETNIRTVFIHFFLKGQKKVEDKEILELVEQTLPRHPYILKDVRMSVREWYSALMDYGAMLKQTVGNPNIQSKHYAKQSKFKGSKRELRGKILRKAASLSRVLLTDFESREHPISEIFEELLKEGFLRKVGRGFRLA